MAGSVHCCHQYMPLLEALQMLVSLAALAKLKERPHAPNLSWRSAWCTILSPEGAWRGRDSCQPLN